MAGIDPSLAAVLFGLIAAVSWGSGDFSGALATRRTNVYGVVVISHAIGLVLLVVLAFLRADPALTATDIAWSIVAGIASCVGIMALYSALAIGQMCVAAPITAVLAAAIPAIFGAFSEGLPTPLQVAGFVLAFLGVWLLTRSEGEAGRPAGIGLAILAGGAIGFLLVVLSLASTTSTFWPLVISRGVSSSTMLVIATFSQKNWLPPPSLLGMVLLAGIFDIGGNLFFILAAQVGRLDVAAILSSLYPASTVALASLLLKERLNRLQAAGMLATFIAIILIAAPR